MLKQIVLSFTAFTLLNGCYFFNNQSLFPDSSPTQTAYQYNLQGIQELKDKQYSKAIELFSRAITRDTKKSHIYQFNRGIAYAEQKKYNQAIKDYKQVLKVKPNSVPVLYNMAIAYSYLNQIDEAIDTSAKAILINPSYAPAYGNLSWNYLFKKNFRMSLLKAVQALERDPKMYWVYTNLGHAYLFLDQYKLALQAYRASQMPQVVLDDYKDLRQAGIYHRDMSRVENLFKRLMRK